MAGDYAAIDRERKRGGGNAAADGPKALQAEHLAQSAQLGVGLGSFSVQRLNPGEIAGHGVRVFDQVQLQAERLQDRP